MTAYANKILNLALILHQWLGDLAGLEPERRARVADYAEAIAETLNRAGDALARFERRRGDRSARRQVIREFGRMRGYVETIVDVLQHRLDGRKLAGVKRRLETICASELRDSEAFAVNSFRIDRLADAEGYFRALADGLRA